MTPGLVHFIHGKESEPSGSKIMALASVASATSARLKHGQPRLFAHQ
jgi:hypothetical protein